MSSSEHRQKLAQALSCMEVAPYITPEAMMAAIVTKPTIATKPTKHVVTFTEADLPLEGTDHNKPLHVTMKCMGKWIPVVLIDIGSALNVCPLWTALCLGLKPKDFTPSDLTVRAYDRLWKWRLLQKGLHRQ